LEKKEELRMKNEERSRERGAGREKEERIVKEEIREKREERREECVT
jgi:hypothetical protein